MSKKRKDLDEQYINDLKEKYSFLPGGGNPPPPPRVTCTN